MKKLTLIILALALTLSLAGCLGPKEFTCQELTMNVPANVEDHSGESGTKSFTFALGNDKLAIFGLREKIADFPKGDSMTLEEYAQAVLDANGDTDAQVSKREGESYLYFQFRRTLEDGDYQYLAAVYKADEAFWLVQIAAPVGDYDEEEFFTYLDSVSFS